MRQRGAGAPAPAWTMLGVTSNRGVLARQRPRVLDQPGRRDVPPAEGELTQPDERQPGDLRQLRHEAATHREPARDRRAPRTTVEARLPWAPTRTSQTPTFAIER